MKNRVKFQFIDYIPEYIDEGTIYISLEYNTAVHKCMCGCGNEVVTPISPSGWSIKYDGESISLDPSIGNWSYECQSHYWIKESMVVESYQFSDEEIIANRKSDKNRVDKIFQSQDRTSFFIKTKQLLNVFIEFLKRIANLGN